MKSVSTLSTPNPALRHDWTRDEVRSIYDQPLLELVFQAQQVHRQFHNPQEVQFCRLLSIKTGGCPEFCMGAAWREVRDGKDFDAVLEMVRGVAALDMEVCCTLGMLTREQADRLAEAGLTAYNHNLDTSPEFYDRIITTRRYEERLRTLDHVRQAGITVCCGGIIGMGESDDDRVGLLHQLASLDPHPESVPINMLVAVEGTPLAKAQPADPLALVRCIATARVLMPASMVRLSAGRRSLSREAAALCFMAGANSIFTGEKLLTTPNPEVDEDEQLFRDLGLRPMPYEQS
ncbi:MAG: biotin synthase BioB [Acidobacteriota bacterium]